MQISPLLGQPQGQPLQLQLLRTSLEPAAWPVSVPGPLRPATVWHGCCRRLARQVAVQALVLPLVLVDVQLPRRGAAAVPPPDPCQGERGLCLVWRQLPSVPGLQLWPMQSAQAPPPCLLLALELVLELVLEPALELVPRAPAVKDRASQAASHVQIGIQHSVAPRWPARYCRGRCAVCQGRFAVQLCQAQAQGGRAGRDIRCQSESQSDARGHGCGCRFRQPTWAARVPEPAWCSAPEVASCR